MTRKCHSPELIAAVLRRVEVGIPIAELRRKAWRTAQEKQTCQPASKR